MAPLTKRSRMTPKRKRVAPKSVEEKLASSALHYALVALAVHRGKDDPDYLATLEIAACEFEDALAGASKWIRPLLKAR